MEYSEYIGIVSEHYDLSDPYTMEKVVYCTEAEREANIEHLTNKLYMNIRDRVDFIDFGTIPQSKGDITKVQNYQEMVECINTITAIIKEYNQPTTQIDVLSSALDNIQSRTRLWEKAFAMDIEFPMIMYNTMVLSVVASISLLITTCIEYIKNRDNTIQVAFDKAAYLKSRDHVLFLSLRDFNMACVKGDTDRLVQACIKSNVTRLKEAYISEDGREPVDLIQKALKNKNVYKFVGVVVGLMNIKRILQWIFYAIRNIVYYFFAINMKVSDYFTSQAEFLQINAENLQYKDKYEGNEDEMKKVYDKQMKWVERFKKWANVFMIKDAKARKEAQKQSDEDSKPSKYNENDGGLF